MATKDERSKATSGSGVKRRTVLRGLATGFAGAVAAPHASSLAAPEASPPVAQAPSETGASPSLLNEQDRETLANLAELLVPGSVDAGVPAILDRVAAVDTVEAQRQLLSSIRAFEGEARTAHGSRFVDLDESARFAILESAAEGSHPALQDALVGLRNVIAEIYFATEPGMRKLGWTPRSAWRELPRCEHPSDDHR